MRNSILEKLEYNKVIHCLFESRRFTEITLYNDYVTYLCRISAVYGPTGDQYFTSFDYQRLHYKGIEGVIEFLVDDLDEFVARYKASWSGIEEKIDEQFEGDKYD